MVRVIIFDCFGVLTTDHWKEFVATLPLEQIEPARALMYEHDAGSLNRAELIQQVQKLTGQTPQGIERLLGQEEAKNVELLEYIRHLKTSYKVGLLSNIGSNWIRESFLSKKEQALFDEMIFSYEIRLAKPDPKIFELAAERLGEDLADCVLVDDSEGHIGAAARLGMKTIVYQNFQQMKRELELLLEV
jgi:HAD superfamily hydrolase (TIGR01509 family)